MTKMDRAIIDECVNRTRELLEHDWDEIASMKDENEGRIKLSAAYLISYKGNEQAVKTSLTFGRKVTDVRESIINPDQMDLPLAGNGDEPNAAEVDEMVADNGEVRKKRRARKV